VSSSEVRSAQLTILTPTWNRKHLLSQLYESLKRQDVPEGSFEWLVVDDGSTDGTLEWVQTKAVESSIPIRWLRLDNGGKHRAWNRGLTAVASPWVLVVDSDDWLVENALCSALTDIMTRGNDPEILAFVAPCSLPGLKEQTSSLPSQPIRYAEWLETYKRDCSVLVRTETLKAYPFPEYAGEKFIAESVVFSQMFRDGGIAFTRNTLIGREYHPGGLSDRSVQMRASSPLGAMRTYGEEINAKVRGMRKVRAIINYYRYFFHAKANHNPDLCIEFSVLKILAIPLGAAIYMFDRGRMFLPMSLRKNDVG